VAGRRPSPPGFVTADDRAKTDITPALVIIWAKARGLVVNPSHRKKRGRNVD
jgi:hypothetical protein